MGGVKVSPFADVDGKRQDAFLVFPEDLVIIGLDTKDGTEHPLWDPRIMDPVEPKMVANVRAYGVFEPVIMQRLEDGRVVVLDGRQRVRAAREANKQAKAAGEEPMRVPVANIRKGDVATAQGIMISANEIRRDDTMAVKAEKAKKLVEVYGRTQAEVATMFGVSVEAVRGWLALADAPEEVKQAVASGAVAPSTAVAIARLPAAERPAQLEKATAAKAAGKRMTGAQLDQSAKAAKDATGTVATVAPSKAVLRKIIHSPAAKETLPEDFIRGIRFALGELRAERIAGLKAVIDGEG